MADEEQDVNETKDPTPQGDGDPGTKDAGETDKPADDKTETE